MNIPFWNQYAMILRGVLEGGWSQRNARTGVTILAAPEGASFTIDLSDNILPTIGLRKTMPAISAAENAWCILGHNHIDWLRRHTKAWDQFADVKSCVVCIGDDPKCPNCNGTGKTYWLDAAYGYRWRVKFGRDQLALAINALRKDPSDRRVWVSSWDPAVDGLGEPSKTVPCPVGFTLSIMGGRLNSTLMIRSSDLYMGLPYDVMRHALLMKAVSESIGIGIELGIMRVTLAHPHIYEPYFETCHMMLREMPIVPPLRMPAWSVAEIATLPDVYVDLIRDLSVRVTWPGFNPKHEVVA